MLISLQGLMGGFWTVGIDGIVQLVFVFWTDGRVSSSSLRPKWIKISAKLIEHHRIEEKSPVDPCCRMPSGIWHAR